MFDVPLKSIRYITLLLLTACVRAWEKRQRERERINLPGHDEVIWPAPGAAICWCHLPCWCISLAVSCKLWLCEALCGTENISFANTYLVFIFVFSLSPERPINRGAAHHRKSGSVISAWKGAFELVCLLAFLALLLLKCNLHQHITSEFSVMSPACPYPLQPRHPLPSVVLYRKVSGLTRIHFGPLISVPKTNSDSEMSGLLRGRCFMAVNRSGGVRAGTQTDHHLAQEA